MKIITLNLKKSAAIVSGLALLFTAFIGTNVLAATPSAPVITTPSQSTTTNPVILTGTADASTTITVTGGASMATATTTAGGNWSATVNLTPNSVNTLSVVAADVSTTTDVSATSTVVITHDGSGPSAPVVTFPTTPYSTSTNPFTIYGTGEASSTVTVSGGSSTSTATVNGSGNWSALVNFNSSSTASTTNNISVYATDQLGNTGSSTNLVITLIPMSVTPTSTPVITLSGQATTTVFACNTFVEPGYSAVDSMGNTITATSTGTVGTEPGTYTITYSATDAFGNSATTTRTVVALECHGGGNGNGGSSRPSTPSGISVAAGVTPSATVIPGQAIGLNLLQNFLAAPGQVRVLGAATFQFVSDLRVGMSGAEVLELQRRLAEIGFFHGPQTGYYGPVTRAAVMRLQRNNGLSATGVLDASTRALLNS